MITIRKAGLTFKNTLSKRKKTTEIIIHCSATKEGKNFTVQQIHNMHLKNGWSGIGYNFYIDINGDVWEGRPVDYVGSHTTNHNSISVGICYCGGIDNSGKAKDTRNEKQIASMIELCKEMHKKYPNATFHGHREFANKACPCFDVKSWIATINLNGVTPPQQEEKPSIDLNPKTTQTTSTSTATGSTKPIKDFVESIKNLFKKKK